ncbi:Acyl-protein thioesterase 1-like protein [Dinothrombium tinctorium]|uniref:palmitoyl-protein hydrolase n=1 Tax=Dinothrombium tinctorium TaxID=1965070 RepID=A0A3S3PA23_9ACAR|nr:Acyl-protein thioesterase 1-like protein [Dinothrombium tinctorium]
MSTHLNNVVINPKDKHSATIIFLHGLGDTGHGWASTIAQIKPSFAKCICPTAPRMPVTLNGGFEMPSWFDLLTLDASGPEDANGIRRATEWIHSLLDEEIKNGIPSNRIVLGGFSQGGGLALHAALRYQQPLAGLLAFSCWLPLHKEYPAALAEANKNVPILQCHGDIDPIVPCQWGRLSAEILSRLTTKHEFKVYKGMMHSSNPEELRDARDFLAKCLPSV